MSSYEENERLEASCLRLIYDFIVADGYVSQRELDIFNDEKFIIKYNTKNLRLIELSESISFAEALSCVASSKRKNEILNDLIKITGTSPLNIDNELNSHAKTDELSIKCSSTEARMLLAAILVITQGARIITINKPVRLSKKELIYIDYQDDPEKSSYDEDIIKNFDYYRLKLAVHGLNLASVSYSSYALSKFGKFSSGFGKEERKDDNYIRKILSFLYPNKKNTFLEEIIRKLPHITTKEFSKDIFFDKVSQIPPSFMLKIKDSIYAEGIKKSMKVQSMDVLLIPIKGKGNPVERTIDNLITEYNQLSDEAFSHFTYNRKSHFQIRGWDKSFLDYVINKETKGLVISKINIVKRKNWHVELCSNVNVVHQFTIGPQPLAFYILIIYMSSIGLKVVSEKPKNDQWHSEIHKKMWEYSQICLQPIYKKIKTKDTLDSSSSFTSMFQKFKKKKEYVNIPEEYKIVDEKIGHKGADLYHLLSIKENNLDFYTVVIDNQSISLASFLEDISNIIGNFPNIVQ